MTTRLWSRQVPGWRSGRTVIATPRRRRSTRPRASSGPSSTVRANRASEGPCRSGVAARAASGAVGVASEQLIADQQQHGRGSRHHHARCRHGEPAERFLGGAGAAKARCAEAGPDPEYRWCGQACRALSAPARARWPPCPGRQHAGGCAACSSTPAPPQPLPPLYLPARRSWSRRRRRRPVEP